MKQNSPTDSVVEGLLQRYVENGIEQDEAIFQNENQKFRILFREMVALEEELKSRGQGRLLMRFYDHPNLQLSLNAAKATLAIAPIEARHQLEAIRSSKIYPQAADAGMAVRMLDRGAFKPE